MRASTGEGWWKLQVFHGSGKECVGHSESLRNVEGRRLVSLAWVAERWACSRQTCRRVLERHGVGPLYLGGGARNATLRFDLADVERVESASQAPGDVELSEPVQGSDHGEGGSTCESGTPPPRGRSEGEHGEHDGLALGGGR